MNMWNGFERISQMYIPTKLMQGAKQKAMNDMAAGYVKSALDYRALEYRCDLFEQKSSRL